MMVLERINGIVLLAICIVLNACNEKKVLDREEYVKWITDSECALNAEKQIGDYLFIAQHRPVDYMVLNEFDVTEENIDPIVFDSVKKEFEGMDYFILKMATADKSKDVLSFKANTPEDYYKRVQYFSTDAQQDIYMVDDTDTIRCSLFHFERTYGASPFNNLLLGFEKKSTSTVTTKRLLFNDQLFGNGLLIFTFSDNTLRNIPQLKL